MAYGWGSSTFSFGGGNGDLFGPRHRSKYDSLFSYSGNDLFNVALSNPNGSNYWDRVITPRLSSYYSEGISSLEPLSTKPNIPLSTKPNILTESIDRHPMQSFIQPSLISPKSPSLDPMPSNIPQKINFDLVDAQKTLRKSPEWAFMKPEVSASLIPYTEKEMIHRSAFSSPFDDRNPLKGVHFSTRLGATMSTPYADMDLSTKVNVGGWKSKDDMSLPKNTHLVGSIDKVNLSVSALQFNAQFRDAKTNFSASAGPQTIEASWNTQIKPEWDVTFSVARHSHIARHSHNHPPRELRADCIACHQQIARTFCAYDLAVGTEYRSGNIRANANYGQILSENNREPWFEVGMSGRPGGGPHEMGITYKRCGEAKKPGEDKSLWTMICNFIWT